MCSTTNSRNSISGLGVVESSGESMKLDIGTCRSRTGPRKLRFRILAGDYASRRPEFPPMFVCLGPSSPDSGHD